MVSESIGTLFRTQHSNLTGGITEALRSGNNSTIATFTKSFKYSAFRNENSVHFVSYVKILVETTKNKDVEVKQNVL